jgi:hypothetical protein
MRTDHPLALMQQEAERMFDHFGGMFGEAGWGRSPVTPGIDEGAVLATFDKGVLRIVLPELPEAGAKVRRIAIGKA